MAGRPRKEIDEEQFRTLCGYQCTLADIAGFFNCNESTIERWCQRELKMNFAEAYKMYSATGKISLRRHQFKLAEKNAAMAIFLGKQYLGQKEQPDNDDPETFNKAKEILEGVDSAID